jgi:hypothetical protein
LQKVSAGDDNPELHTYQKYQVDNRVMKEQTAKGEAEKKAEVERDARILKRTAEVAGTLKGMREAKKAKLDVEKKAKLEKSREVKRKIEKENKDKEKRGKETKKELEKERKERDKNEEKQRKELRKKKRTDRDKKKKDFHNWNDSQIKKWKGTWDA